MADINKNMIFVHRLYPPFCCISQVFASMYSKISSWTRYIISFFFLNNLLFIYFIMMLRNYLIIKKNIIEENFRKKDFYKLKEIDCKDWKKVIKLRKISNVIHRVLFHRILNCFYILYQKKQKKKKKVINK